MVHKINIEFCYQLGLCKLLSLLTDNYNILGACVYLGIGIWADNESTRAWFPRVVVDQKSLYFIAVRARDFCLMKYHNLQRILYSYVCIRGKWCLGCPSSLFTRWRARRPQLMLPRCRNKTVERFSSQNFWIFLPSRSRVIHLSTKTVAK